MEHRFLRPIKRFVLLVDDQPERVEDGIVLMNGIGTDNMDYVVARVGEKESVDFGPGDRVILNDPNIGRKVMVDGTVYRLVRVSDIIAVID